MMQLYPDSIMWKLAEGDLNRVSGKTAFIASERDDECAKALINEYVENLAFAIGNTVNIFQPDVICIGGGISREGEKLLKPLRERVKERTFGFDERRTKIVAASFRNDAGIIGAALLGLQSESNKVL